MPCVYPDLVRRILFPILSVAIVACSACESLAIQSRWLSASNGQWTDASRWSTIPSSPNNGQPNSDDTYTVLIDASGVPYVVTLNDSVAVDGVTINAIDATLALRSGRLETARIEIENGKLLVSNAEIVGSEIVGNGSFVIDPAPFRATAVLDAAKLGVNVLVPGTSGSPSDNRLSLRNGLTLLGDSQLQIDGIVDIEGSQSIGGTGSVLLNGSIRMQPNTTFTIEPDVTMRSADSGGLIGFRFSGTPRPTFSGLQFINKGTIVAESPGRTFQILESDPSDQPRFDNQGLLEVNGTSRLVLEGDWTNNGVLRVRDEGELWLAGVYRWSDVGNLDRNGGKVHLGGTVSNFGSTIEANSETGPLVLGGVSGVRNVLRGGRISATEGQSWTFEGPELVDVTIGADVSVLTNDIVDIKGDLTLDQATITVKDSGSWLRFQNHPAQQSILGNGKILLQNGRPSRVSFGSLTIDEGIVLDAATQGSDHVRLQGTALRNNGAMIVRPGATMRIVTSGFVNHGTLMNEGRLYIGDDDDQTWRNFGSLILKAGSRTNLSGTITVDDLGTIVDEGSAVELHGIIDLQNDTLDLESLPFQQNLRVFGGEFRNGRLTSSGDKTLDFVNVQFSAFLNDISLATDLFIPGFGTGVWVRNGLALESSTITMPEGASLIFQGDNQRLDGTGVIFAPNRPATSAVTSIRGNELVIGEGIVIRNGTEAFRELELEFRENRGRIIVEAPNTLVTIGENEIFSDSSSWSNNGVIEVHDGTLQLWGNYSTEDIGTLEFSGGEVVLQGNVLNEGRTIQLDATTGDWKFRGTIHGGRIETSEDAIADVAGFLNDVTLAGEAVLFDNFNSSASGVLWIPNSLNFDGGTLTIEPSAELAINQHVVLSGRGEILLNGNPQNTRIQTFTGGEVTIGPAVAVRTGPTGGGAISRSTLPVINQGTISAETRGETLMVGGDLQNTGLLQSVNQSILRIVADNWVNEGLLKVDAGQVVITGNSFENGMDGTIVGAGIIEFTSTSLVNSGTIAPGNSAGRLFINGSLELQPTSSLDLELGGLFEGDFDSIAVTLSALLDGIVHVSLIDGFRLGPNQEFLILDVVGEVSGEFIGLPEGASVGSFGGEELFITYAAGSGNDVALFTAVPEPAAGVIAPLVLVFSLALPCRKRAVSPFA